MKIKWKQTFEANIVDRFNEETDNIEEDHNEIIKEGEVDEVDLEENGENHYNVQFGSGGVAFCIHKSAFEIIEG